MATNTLLDRRYAEYYQLIEDFKNEVKDVKMEGITGPHLPGVGNCYESAKYKIAFCGWETYGWDSLTTFMNTSTENLVTITDSCITDNEYLKWPSNYHATFWGFVLKFIAKFYNVYFENLINNKYPELLHSFIWANSNSIERYEVSSQESNYEDWEKVKNASYKFDDLNHVINSCSPKLVLILYNNAREDYFLNNSSLSNIFGINIRDKSNYLSIENSEKKYSYFYARNSRTHIFKMPHPRWIGLYSGIGIDNYIDYLINDIRNYKVWDSLPASFDDWNLKETKNIDKSSMEFKYHFIASLAHLLTNNNMVMKGSELQTTLNTNNILTCYGSQYSSNGGRGVFTLIRNAYKYFYKKKDYQTSYEIARSFVNQYGKYAY